MKVKLVLMWLTALAVALGTSSPDAVAKVAKDRREGVPVALLPVQTATGGEGLSRGVSSAAGQMADAVTPNNSSGKTWIQEKIRKDDFDERPMSDSGNPPPEPIAEQEGPVESGPFAQLPIEPSDAKTRRERSIEDSPAVDMSKSRLAQFQVPRRVPEGAGTPSERKAREEIQKLPAALKFQYAFGSDSELTYRRNEDLNKNLKDDFVLFAPTLFGLMTYRPTAWLETTMEMTLEYPISLKEEDVVILPDGTRQPKTRKHASLLVDQAYVTFKGLGPFDVSIGRRNFEDERLFLYDAALDAVFVKLKLGHFHAEASVSRENLVDGDLFNNPPNGHIDNYMLYLEYRGIVDNKLAVYAIVRDDHDQPHGPVWFLGLRAYGRPTNRFNYWTDFALNSGRDELNQKLKGNAVDIGFTYRFPDLPFQPSLTLGAAFGSGDGDPNDNKNREFRQTGLQSNEGRFGGVTQFKRFGEFLDPELSNIWIYTAGISLRLAANAFLDLVYHYYRLHRVADQLRSSGTTAIMAQDDRNLSKNVGNEIDIILGFRNLFGLRRLGFEVRAGYFLPGSAFRLEQGDPNNPSFRKADAGISVLSVFIW